MLKVGLIDADATARGKVTFPNLALMKISAAHKAKGDSVEWFDTTLAPLLQPFYDIVYISKVFSDEYTPDYTGFINAGQIIRGGSGYAIRVEGGREVYDRNHDSALDDETEHIMPDYSIYPQTLADGGYSYGFLSRGCPRNCEFCHVCSMQGRIAHRVAKLSEFWTEQKNIVLYDPNVLACKEWRDIFQELIDSKAYVDFSQGLDIRLLTDEKLEMLNKVKYKRIHFAWDKPNEDLTSAFLRVKEQLRKCNRNTVSAYILCNNGEPFEEDVRRVEFIKSCNIQPYVMIYRQETASMQLKHLKRYANNPYVCWATPSFNDYVPATRSDRYGKTGMKHKRIGRVGEDL